MVPMEIFVRFIQPWLPDLLVRLILKVYLCYAVRRLRQLDHPSPAARRERPPGHDRDRKHQAPVDSTRAFPRGALSPSVAPRPRTNALKSPLQHPPQAKRTPSAWPDTEHSPPVAKMCFPPSGLNAFTRCIQGPGGWSIGTAIITPLGILFFRKVYKKAEDDSAAAAAATAESAEG